MVHLTKWRPFFLFTFLYWGHERPSTSLLDQLKGHFEAIYCKCLTKLIVFNVF